MRYGIWLALAACAAQPKPETACVEAVRQIIEQPVFEGCILSQPVPKEPIMLCKEGEINCEFRYIDLAKKADYSVVLARWADSAWQLCGKK